MQRRTTCSFRDLSNRMTFIKTIDISRDKTRRMVIIASFKYIFIVIEMRSWELNGIGWIKVLGQIVIRHLDFC